MNIIKVDQYIEICLRSIYIMESVGSMLQRTELKFGIGVGVGPQGLRTYFQSDPIKGRPEAKMH